jgi:hypothetical protein
MTAEQVNAKITKIRARAWRWFLDPFQWFQLYMYQSKQEH